MDRSYDEIVRAALEIRQGLIDKGQDPLTGKFFVTAREKITVLDHPPFMVPELTEKRDRICGLRLTVIADGPPCRCVGPHEVGPCGKFLPRAGLTDGCGFCGHSVLCHTPTG